MYSYHVIDMSQLHMGRRFAVKSLVYIIDAVREIFTCRYQVGLVRPCLSETSCARFHCKEIIDFESRY